MDGEAWATLRENAPETYWRAYERFMYERKNEFCCESCPENQGDFQDNLNGRYECGQYHCWVTAHCDARELTTE